MFFGLLSVVRLLMAATGVVSVVLYLVGYCEARRFFRPRMRRGGQRSDEQHPSVTILKPLKGSDPELYANLSSFCGQEYPSLQIVFGVADPADPAVQVVRELQAKFPSVMIDLVIDPRQYGTNAKVSNLHNMYRAAKHEIILVADSDIRAAPGYLRRVVAEFDDPHVGLVTCLYRAVSRGNLPALVDALCVNTDFVPMVLVARAVEKPSYAFGATIAMRRSALDEIGGFLPLANYLADDYQLGNRIAARGYRLALSDVVVETVMAAGSWRRMLDHQLRWARTQRACRPAGYFGSVVTQGTLWATLNLFCSHFSPAACALAATTYGLRIATARAICNRYLGAPLSVGTALLVPMKDLFTSAVWLLSFLGNTVHWGGHTFRITKDGQMTQMPPPTAPLPSPTVPEI
jgi:ceramide glucosyltransferase